MPIINPTLPNDGETIDASDLNNPINAILAVLNGGIDSNNLAPGAISLAQLGSALTPFLVPTGTMNPFASSIAPTGWLLCDGSSLLRSSYSALFAALGTNYGSADGTHFNIPDMRGRVPVGNDAMTGTAANRTQRATTITTTNASPTATVASAVGLSIGMTISATGVTAGTTIVSIAGTTITMSANATASGSGVAARLSLFGNDAQVLGSAGGVDIHQLVTAQMPGHNHGQNADNSSNNAAPYWPSVSARGSVSIGAGFTASNGGDQAHPNLQPSLILNYIIKT